MGRDRSIIVERFCTPRTRFFSEHPFRANCNVKYKGATIVSVAWKCVNRHGETGRGKKYRLRKRQDGGGRLPIAPRDLDVTTVSKRNERLPWLQSYFRRHVTNSYKIPTRSSVVAWQKLARFSGEILMHRNLQMSLISDTTISAIIEEPSLL